jgi:hypothetical protein
MKSRMKARMTTSSQQAPSSQGSTPDQMPGAEVLAAKQTVMGAFDG